MLKSLKIINGNIITPYQLLPMSSLYVENGIITEIKTGNITKPADTIIDAEGKYISPGFIDIHVHGGGNSDFMDATVKDFLTVAETHLKHGTTAMVPTTLTAGKEELLHSIDIYKEAIKKNQSGAQFLGMHIEGPYFAMSQRGAQDPRYIRNPDKSEYTKIVEYAGGCIARWSVAPELKGALEFGRYLRTNNILASIAHTDAVYSDVINAYENGYTLATHFYSGMSGVSRRNAFRYAGVVESVYLMDEIDVEIIADGCHLPKPLLKLIFKVKGVDRIALITDAMRAAGTNDTESILGSRKDGLKVIVEDGVAKLPDRQSFAGSIATADRLVRTMVNKAGVSLIEAVRMASLVPARIMRTEAKKGSIGIGKDADILIFDNDINIQKVFICGNLIYKK